MKRIVLFIALSISYLIGYSQVNCLGTAPSTINLTDKVGICNGNLQRTATVSQLIAAGIDTTKVGRIEQGRGTAPIFMYFNGVAWVRNDTSYVSQTGTNKFSGDFLSNQSFFSFGLNSTNNNIIYHDQKYGRMISENSSSGIQSSVGAFSSSDGSIQLVVTNPTPAYSRQFVINGSNSATPNLAYMFDKGIAYYNGDYSAEMEASQNLIPSLKKVKQLISDSLSSGGGGGSSTIDTTKVGRVEQGRGSVPATLSFDGVKWYMNDTAYAPLDDATRSFKNTWSAKNIYSQNYSTYFPQLITTENQSLSVQTIQGLNKLNALFLNQTNPLDNGFYGWNGASWVKFTFPLLKWQNETDFLYNTIFIAQEGDYSSQAFVFNNYIGDRSSRNISASGEFDISQIIGGQSDTLADGKIWIGDGTNTAFPRTLSGDVTVSNLGVTSYNGVVPATKGGAGTVNGILKANGSGVVSAATAGTDYVAVFLQYKVAYVDTLGDNATAIVGRIDRKFATIDAALLALPSSGGVVEIGVGTFQSPTGTNLKNNVWLKGSGQPDFNWTVTPSAYNQTRTAPTKLVGGTILQNTLTNLGVQNKNIWISDLGVDVGSDWCTASNAGVAKDGIVFSRGNSVPAITTPVTNVHLENVTSLGKTASSLFHAILFDNGYDVVGRNIKTCFNVHGLALKASVANIDGIQCYGHEYDGIIVKSNDYAYSRSTNITNAYIGSVGTFDGGGFNIQNGETGVDAVFIGLNLSNFYIDNTTRGITLQNAGIDNVNISNGIIVAPQSHGIYAPTTSPFNNSKISNVIVRSSLGIGVLINSALNTTISNLSVISSVGNGINLSGNGKLICDNIIELGSSATGVVYGANVYAYNVNASSVSGTPAQINIEGSVGSSAGNTAIDLAGSSPYFNFRKPLSIASYYTSTYKTTNGGSNLPLNALFWSGINDADLNLYGALINTQGALDFIRSNGTNKIAISGVRTVSEDYTANQEAGALIFDTKPAGSALVERMRISSSGNVGIGVTSVTTGRLQISAGTASIAGLQLANQTAYTGSVPGSITLENANDISHVGNVTLKRGATASIGTSDAQTLQLITGNTNRVSIGTTGIVTLTSDLVGTATQNIFNTISTTGNVLGAATSITIGATTGTTTIRNATVNLSGGTLDGAATQNIFNTTSSTVNAFGGASVSTIFGSATGNTAYSIASNATTSGNTKTISIGTAGLSGSTTAINIGSSVSGANTTITLGGGTLVGIATQNVFNTISTTVNAFGAATTATIFGTSTSAVTYNIGNNATASATTKQINIGTGGVSTSITNVVLGSGTAGATSLITVNGALKLPVYTVATLPTAVAGTMVYVSDALAPTYNTTVVGGGAVQTPVFYNGTDWTCH